MENINKRTFVEKVAICYFEAITKTAELIILKHVGCHKPSRNLFRENRQTTVSIRDHSK